MTGPFVRISSALLATLVVVGCRTEPVTWQVPLHDVILLNDTLSWSNLIPDTLWSQGEEGLVLEVNTTGNWIDPEALVPNLDTAWTESFTLPFIGGPIPISPGTPLWQDTENISLDLPSTGLRRARLGGGELSMSISSSVAGPLTLRYTLEGASFPPQVNQGSNEIVVQLNEETAVVSLDMTGVVLDLTGEDGTDWSRLFTRWEVLVSNSASESVGVMGDDMLSLTVALTGLEVAQVEGRFDTQELSTTDATAVMDLESLQGLQVGWTELELALALENTTGLDLMGKIHSLERIDTLAEEVETLSLTGPAMAQDVFLSRALVAGSGAMDSWSIQPTSASIGFTSDDGNLAEFMASIPDALSWNIDVEVNPLGDVSGGHDRIDLTQLPTLNVALRAPLEVSSARAVFLDTLELSPPDWVDFSGELDLAIDNGFPVGARLQMRLVELPEPWGVFPFGEEWWVFPEVAVAGAVGSPLAPSLTEVSLSFIQPHFEALRHGAKLELKVELESTGSTARFDANQSMAIQGHLQGNAILSVQ